MAGGASVCLFVCLSVTLVVGVFRRREIGSNQLVSARGRLQDADHMIRAPFSPCPSPGGGSFNRDSGSVLVSLCRRDRGEGAVGLSAASKAKVFTGFSVSVKMLYAPQSCRTRPSRAGWWIQGLKKSKNHDCVPFLPYEPEKGGSPRIVK